MNEYKYKGESFFLEDTDACEIKVSDTTHSVSVTLNNCNRLCW